MILTRDESGRRNYAAPAAAACLGLAAAPTFAVMAVLSSLPGGGTDMISPAAHALLPLSGMVQMYALMSIFHVPPWLKLISRS